MRFLFLLLFLCAHIENVFAGEIFLNNGDRISGKIVAETDATMTIETRAMGRISIDKSFIRPEEAQNSDISPWQRKVSIGYSQTSGNTKVS